MYLNIKNGSIEINGNTILEDINFLVKNNEKVGVVGRNGSGKGRKGDGDLARDRIQGGRVPDDDHPLRCHQAHAPDRFRLPEEGRKDRAGRCGKVF